METTDRNLRKAHICIQGFAKENQTLSKKLDLAEQANGRDKRALIQQGLCLLGLGWISSFLIPSHRLFGLGAWSDTRYPVGHRISDLRYLEDKIFNFFRPVIGYLKNYAGLDIRSIFPFVYLSV